jgi:hypothetical protein
MTEDKGDTKAKSSADTPRRTDVVVATTSSSIAALLVQRNLEKGKPISVPSVDKTGERGKGKDES